MMKQTEVVGSTQNVKFSLSGGDVPENEKQVELPLAPEKPNLNSKNSYRYSEAGERVQKTTDVLELLSREESISGRQEPCTALIETDTGDQKFSKTVWRTKSDVIACSSTVSSHDGEYRARSDLHLSFGPTLNNDSLATADYLETKTEALNSDRSRRSFESLVSLKKSTIKYDGTDEKGMLLLPNGLGVHCQDEREFPYFTPSGCSLTSASLTDEDKGRLSYRSVERLSTVVIAEATNENKRTCGDSFIANILDEIIEKIERNYQNESEYGKLSDRSVITVANKSSRSPVPTDIFEAMHEECVTAYKMIKNYRIRCGELESRLNDMISMGRRMIPLLNTAQFKHHSANNQTVRTPVACSNKEMVYQLKGERNALGLSDVIAASVVVMEESDHRPVCRPGNCGDTGANEGDSEYEIWCVAVECDDPNCLSHDSKSSLNSVQLDSSSQNDDSSPKNEIVSIGNEKNSEKMNSIGVQVNLLNDSETKIDTKDFGVQVCVSDEKNSKSAPRIRSDMRKKESVKATNNLTSNSKVQLDNIKIQATNESRERKPDLSAGDSKLSSLSNSRLAEDEVGDKTTVESSSRSSSGVTKETFVRCGKKEDVMLNHRSNARSILSSHKINRTKGTTQDRSLNSSNVPILQKLQQILPVTDSSKTSLSNKSNEDQNKNDNTKKPAWNSTVSITNSIHSSSLDRGPIKALSNKNNAWKNERRGGVGERTSAKANQMNRPGDIRDSRETVPPSSPPVNQKPNAKPNQPMKEADKIYI